jgi:hypothetical protein
MASLRHHHSGSLLTRVHWQFITHPPCRSLILKEIRSSTQKECQRIATSLPSLMLNNPLLMRASNKQKNYWESYMNIRRAEYNCLDDNINNAFKVSNNPALIGWNPLMEPREIFGQIMATYGHPTPSALLQNDMLFWSVYSPQDAPEVLFR